MKFTIREDEEGSPLAHNRAEWDLALFPKDADLKQVTDALENIDLYGSYLSNMRSKREVEQAVIDHFGPTLPIKKRQLEKERGKPFPPKTKQAIDDLVRSLTSKPTLLSYEVKDDHLIFPKGKNPSRDTIKNVLKTVLGNADIKYKLEDKENIAESFTLREFYGL